MKKIIIFAFTLALAFSLCACACSKEAMDPTGNNTSNATTAPTTETIMPTTDMTIPVPSANIPDPSINTEPTHTTDGSVATILPKSGILQ